MPYPTNDTLPPTVQKRYSDRCQTIWRQVWNETYAKHSDEGLASRYAYTAANQCQEARSMTDLAFRTVFENEDVHVIEGLLYPFAGPFKGGKDSYGTNFSARTNFYWDLYPDRTPSDPENVAARFVRPVTYQHGFDPDVGLSRIGGYSPVRQDKKGVWVQAQLDKHHEYYDELRALLGEDALGFSGESSEHAVRIAKDGEVREWPAGPASVTPTPSNPFAIVAARAADIHEVVVRISGVRAVDKKGQAVGPPEGGKQREDIPDEDFAGKNKSYPIVTPKSVDKASKAIGRAGPDNYSPDELKANIISIAKRKGPAFVAALPDAWKDEEGLRSNLQTVFEILGTEKKALRAGRRNSTSDQALIDGIHDAAVSLGCSQHTGEANDDRSPDAGRSAGALPIRVYGMERVDARKAIRKAVKRAVKEAARTGSKVGAQEVRRLVG